MVLRPRGRGRVGHRRHLVETPPLLPQRGRFVFRSPVAGHGRRRAHRQSWAVPIPQHSPPPTRSRSGTFACRPRAQRPPPPYYLPMPRAGIVTVAGKPNAGKSTLLNRIIGEKLAIVSEKPQSTRDRVVGIRTEGEVQMIVLDTPGLLNPRYELHRAMRSTALRALQDADVVLYLADATERTPPSLLEAADLETPPRAPVWTVLNKVDAIRPVER